MTDVFELFWRASLQEIKQGFIYDRDCDVFICLICGKSFTRGVIYSDEDQLFEAEKFITIHIDKEHNSTFHFLINMDKKLTGLTDHQKTILELFYEGNSDQEIAKELGTGSTSTIRNHRFTLREKQKQAKIFLALMELLGEHTPKKNTFIEIPRNSKKVDDRFAITEQESQKILSVYFTQGLDGPLEVYPLKEKRRVAILRHIIKHFNIDKTYSEKEINEILKKIYDDYVILRRHLVDYGFMDRTPDGSSYWIKS